MSGGRRTKSILAILVVGVIAAAAYAVVTLRPLPVEVAAEETGVPIRVFGLGTVN